jgi:hypothetical protein
MDPHDGTDWDAAFEALVAPLRPPRYVRVARVAGQATLALASVATACWTVLRLVAEPLNELGRPWL